MHGYNAGVLLLFPLESVFLQMFEVVVSGNFVKTYAEQGVLNQVFHNSSLFWELPQEYNYNIVCETHNKTVRGSTDIKIIHYTTTKPFDRMESPWNCMWRAWKMCLPWFIVDSA